MLDYFFSKNIAFRIVTGFISTLFLSFLLFSILYSIAPTSNGLNGLQCIAKGLPTSNEDRLCILYMLSVETICIFLIPALCMLFCINRKPWKLLHTTYQSNKSILLIIPFIIIANIPCINLLSEINTEAVLAIVGENSALWQNYKQTEILTTALMSPNMICIDILAMSLLPAICEELFFRGLFQTIAIKQFKHKHLSIILIATIFSLLHGDIFNFIPRFVLGLLLGYLFAYTGSILYPVFAHILHNMLVVVSTTIPNLFPENIETIGTTTDLPLIGIPSTLILIGFILVLAKNSHFYQAEA